MTPSSLEPAAERVAPPALDPAAVCTLPADDFGARLAWIDREILPHATGAERRPGGWDLVFAGGRDRPGLVETLDEWVALEAECCGAASIVFGRRDGPGPADVRVEVRGVDPDAEIFSAFARLAGDANEAGLPSRLRSGLAAVGVGTAAGVFVCCVLPLAAVAVFGAIAAPLAGLDAPVPIALTSLASAGAFWLWQRRRRRSDPVPASGSGGCGC